MRFPKDFPEYYEVISNDWDLTKSFDFEIRRLFFRFDKDKSGFVEKRSELQSFFR